MKIISTLLNFILISIILISCEKVINIDLKDSDPIYVIEGELNEGDSLHTIKISKTVKFSDTNIFPAEEGAIVTISDDIGNFEVLQKESPGIYKSLKFLIKGKEGRTYTLKVEIAGKVYTAVSTIPKRVVLEDIMFIENSFSSNGAKNPIPVRNDPFDQQNNYVFNLYQKSVTNDKNYQDWIRDEGIIVLDDVYSNGVTTQQPIFGTIREFLPNDSVRIEMKCVDRNIYKYFYSLSLNGPNGSATPANPISNFDNGCLGYFSAQTKQVLQVIVQ